MASPTRLLAALGLLAALATPSWPSTVDDVYITLSYARRWAEAGALEWTTGERVEGYSNFLFLAAMALGARLGLDIDVLAQLVAFAAGAATLVLLHRRLAPGLAASLSLVALAAWAPLSHWSTIGLETTLYGLLLAAGWGLALRSPASWGSGILVLAFASTTRPEGALHLVGALLVATRSRPTRSALLTATTALGALALYHTVRIAWFGSIVPTPFLVKVAPVGPTRFGAQQWAGDLLTASGLLAATVTAGRLPRRDAGWVLLPLAVQGATLVSASGDWMSWGRLTLPGVVATVCAYATLAQPRPTVFRPWLGAVAALVAVCSFLEPRGYGTVDLQRRSLSAIARSVANLGHGLDTPVAEDFAWAVDQVPSGASVLAVDVGILGDIPGVNILDMRGLTHRPAAEATARGESEAWLRATLADAASRPAFLRLANWDGPEHPPYPEWMLAGYHLRADLRYGGGSIRWYASTDEAPSPAERAERWDEVLRRHPSHPFVRWHAALSAAGDGSLDRGEALAAVGAERWPGMEPFRDAPRSLSLVSATRALEWSTDVGFVLQCGDEAVTRSIDPDERLAVLLVPATDQQGADLQVQVEDPCDGGTAVGRTPLSLRVCTAPRQARLTVRCGPSAPAAVGVSLAPA